MQNQPHKRRRKKKEARRALVAGTLRLLIGLYERVDNPHVKHEIRESIHLMQKIQSGEIVA